jgi:predicted HTH transcriptional regulator
MTSEMIDLLISEGEGLRIEFKERFSTKIDRDIVALSNAKGGYILLGVTDISGGQISGQIGGQLSEKQIDIINAIKENPAYSREKLSSLVGINPSAIQKHLNKLKKLGVIIRVGSDRAGHWKVEY